MQPTQNQARNAEIVEMLETRLAKVRMRDSDAAEDEARFLTRFLQRIRDEGWRAEIALHVIPRLNWPADRQAELYRHDS